MPSKIMRGRFQRKEKGAEGTLCRDRAACGKTEKHGTSGTSQPLHHSKAFHLSKSAPIILFPMRYSIGDVAPAGMIFHARLTDLVFSSR